MLNYVRKGTKLKCSMGSEQSVLDVIHPSNPVNIHGELMANVMDYKPMVNIKPFGYCKSLRAPCIPNTVYPWLPGKTDVLVKGHPALMDDCKCVCAWAGEIEI